METKFSIYQLFVRLFGNTNTQPVFYGSKMQNGCGTLDDITPKAIKGIKSLGITHIWLTGVLEHATLSAYPELNIPADNAWIVKGKAGSPYAIKDYFDVAPDLARNPAQRMKAFEQVVKRIHKEGLKVIIDFVGNHVSRQYHSDTTDGKHLDFGKNDDTSLAFAPGNNYYYLPGQDFKVPLGVQLPPDVDAAPYFERPAKVTGNDCFKSHPHITDWYETVKLNYGVDYEHGGVNHFDPVPDTWYKMKAVLLFWASKGVDGFRCDMAELVPSPFWGWVIDEIKAKYPHIIFIAEVYNPQRYQEYLNIAKFDNLYDKVGLYDELRLLLQEKGDANHISRIWQQQEGFGHKMLRFIENHDEHRVASKHFAGYAWKGIPAFALCAMMGRGPYMMYNGQETGETADEASGFSGADGKTTIFDYWHMPTLQKWVNGGKYDGALLDANAQNLRLMYARINHLAIQSEAIRYGHFYDLQFANKGKSFDYNDRVTYAFLRFTSNERLLIICNFEPRYRHEARVKIPEHAWQSMNIPSNATVLLNELCHGHQSIKIKVANTTDEFDVMSGIPVVLYPWQAYVFQIVMV